MRFAYPRLIVRAVFSSMRGRRGTDFILEIAAVFEGLTCPGFSYVCVCLQDSRSWQLAAGG